MRQASTGANYLSDASARCQLSLPSISRTASATRFYSFRVRGEDGPFLSPLLFSLGCLLCKYTLFTYNNILITQVSTKKTSGVHFCHTTPSPLSCRPRQRHIKSKQCHSSATIQSTMKMFICDKQPDDGDAKTLHTPAQTV